MNKSLTSENIRIASQSVLTSPPDCKGKTHFHMLIYSVFFPSLVGTCRSCWIMYTNDSSVAKCLTWHWIHKCARRIFGVKEKKSSDAFSYQQLHFKCYFVFTSLVLFSKNERRQKICRWTYLDSISWRLIRCLLYLCLLHCKTAQQLGIFSTSAFLCFNAFLPAFVWSQ